MPKTDPVQYEYPINTFGTYAAPILKAVGTNKLYRQRVPSAQGNETILPSLLPDADTLTTNVIIDLSRKNLELTVPPGPANQYWVFSFYDMYVTRHKHYTSLHAMLTTHL